LGRGREKGGDWGGKRRIEGGERRGKGGEG